METTPNTDGRRVTYSAVALDEHGGYVSERMWGDWMNIQSDGHPTPEAARGAGLDMFADSKVARVLIRESVQQGPGLGWRVGNTVSFVERSEGPETATYTVWHRLFIGSDWQGLAVGGLTKEAALDRAGVLAATGSKNVMVMPEPEGRPVGPTHWQFVEMCSVGVFIDRPEIRAAYQAAADAVGTERAGAAMGELVRLLDAANPYTRDDEVRAAAATLVRLTLERRAERAARTAGVDH